MSKRTEPAWIDAFYDAGLYDREYAAYLADEARSSRQVDLVTAQLAVDSDSMVLDLACGEGRHVGPMAGRVARVVGVDRSQRAIQRARERVAAEALHNIDLHVQDMRDLAWQDEFDGGYCFYTSWGYYTDDENVDVLRRVLRSLRRGGRFLLETAARDSLVRNFHERDFGFLDDGTVLTIESSFDPASGRVTTSRSYHFAEGRESFAITYHVPAPDDLARLFALVGFQDVSVLDGETGRVLTLDSERVIVVGRRP